ncbi:type II secretion system major pseudopilin GspG [Aureimonas pseudogalii]|uniref:Type II secretion system core protein G n=1 Tax=Aureimonas pseudogalii TaxID=1744844 RepID=A0A7W6H4H5_9HYPH|nr:type II secretion system major pseudopilin GspG [Aureimonas pseudogalii]MBB3997054.1 general secretion pathway protein G [Aureimonas pseudogalii]
MQPTADTRTNEAAPEGEAGFTLVELLVVLAIIALVGTLVGPRVLGYIGMAKADTAASQIRNLASAVELYYLDAGSYPTADQGLAALTQGDGTPGWNGPYLKQSTGTLDPWGRAYLYEPTAGSFHIASLGRDGKPGGSGEDTDLSGGGN